MVIRRLSRSSRQTKRMFDMVAALPVQTPAMKSALRRSLFQKTSVCQLLACFEQTGWIATDRVNGVVGESHRRARTNADHRGHDRPPEDRQPPFRRR